MRLQDYSSFFRSEDFNAMTVAYDAAWQYLLTNTPTLTADQVQTLKKNSPPDHSGLRLHWEKGRSAAKRDCIAGSPRTTAPPTRTARFAIFAIRPFGNVGFAPLRLAISLPDRLNWPKRDGKEAIEKPKPIVALCAL